MEMNNEKWTDGRIERMMGAQVRSTSTQFDQRAEQFFGSLTAVEMKETHHSRYARWAAPAIAAALTLSLAGVYFQQHHKSEPEALILEDLVWMDETLGLGEAVLEFGNLEVLEMLTWSVKNS
jgi:hypothetical protein